MLLMRLRVEVDRPLRSLISNVGSRDTVTAQPGACLETYGWSIHVPARSRRVGMRHESLLSEVLERAGSLFLCTIDVGDVCVEPGERGPVVSCQREGDAYVLN